MHNMIHKGPFIIYTSDWHQRERKHQQKISLTQPLDKSKKILPNSLLPNFYHPTLQNTKLFFTQPFKKPEVDYPTNFSLLPNRGINIEQSLNTLQMTDNCNFSNISLISVLHRLLISK